jgi:hypothetical protein
MADQFCYSSRRSLFGCDLPVAKRHAKEAEAKLVEVLKSYLAAGGSDCKYKCQYFVSACRNDVCIALTG